MFVSKMAPGVVKLVIFECARAFFKNRIRKPFKKNQLEPQKVAAI